MYIKNMTLGVASELSSITTRSEQTNVLEAVARLRILRRAEDIATLRPVERVVP